LEVKFKDVCWEIDDWGCCKTPIEEYKIEIWLGVEGNHCGVTPSMSPKTEAVSIPINEVKTVKEEPVQGKFSNCCLKDTLFRIIFSGLPSFPSVSEGGSLIDDSIVVEAGSGFIPIGVALVPVEVLHRSILSAIEEAHSDEQLVLEYLGVMMLMGTGSPTWSIIP
jgi:hypothetical protein